MNCSAIPKPWNGSMYASCLIKTFSENSCLFSTDSCFIVFIPILNFYVDDTIVFDLLYNKTDWSSLFNEHHRLTTSDGAIVGGTETNNAHGQTLLQRQGFPIASFPRWNTGCPSTHPRGLKNASTILRYPNDVQI